jgi:hypothetical protein
MIDGVVVEILDQFPSLVVLLGPRTPVLSRHVKDVPAARRVRPVGSAWRQAVTRAGGTAADLRALEVIHCAEQLEEHAPSWDGYVWFKDAWHPTRILMGSWKATILCTEHTN